MNTYTMPAATVAALPSKGSVVYVAVKGDGGDHWIHGCDCGHEVLDHPYRDGDVICLKCPPGPPSFLADLNGKTCETCEGSGHATFGNQVRTSEDCPDCHGTGRALLTIQHECEASWCNRGHDMRYDDGHSRRCSECADGIVTDTRRWTVDGLWPVYNEGERIPEAWLRHVAPARGYGDWCLWEMHPTADEVPCTGRKPWKITPITVTGPPPSPGGYVIALTLRVETP